MQKLSNELLNRLLELPLFKDIQKEDILTTFTLFEEFQLLENEVLFRRGEHYHKGIYFVLEGTVLLTKPKTEIALYCKRQPIGLSTFLGKTTYTMNAKAEEDSLLLFINEVCVYRLMERSKNFKKQLIKSVQERLYEVQNTSNTFLMQSVHQTVGYAMSFPIITISNNGSVQEAAQLMSERNIHSLLVLGEGEKPVGLLTSQDLVNKFLASSKTDKGLTVKEYMDSNFLSLPPDYPLMEALSEMQARQTTHAVVMRGDEPLGVLSIFQILPIILENTNLYVAHIDNNVASIDELKKIFSNIHIIAKALATASRIPREELSALSDMHRAIHRKVFSITSQFCNDGLGIKLNDNSYCYIMLGDGARKEFDMAPYIDDALILGDEVKEEDLMSYNVFMDAYHKNLQKVGYKKVSTENSIYPYSKVFTPTNPRILRHSIWLEKIEGWKEEQNKSEGYHFAYMLDMVAVEGDITLAWSIRKAIFDKIEENKSLIKRTASNTPYAKLPISHFGDFITNSGEIDLKADLISHIITLTRDLSGYANIQALSTIERIQHLARRKVLSFELANKAIEAFDTAMEILITEQINMATDEKEISTKINPTSLSLFHQENLKRSLNFATIFIKAGSAILE